ncbi:uncharacterized protein METZ01_LOCUS383396, partial [marine metagenome]
EPTPIIKPDFGVFLSQNNTYSILNRKSDAKWKKPVLQGETNLFETCFMGFFLDMQKFAQ